MADFQQTLQCGRRPFARHCDRVLWLRIMDGGEHGLNGAFSTRLVHPRTVWARQKGLVKSYFLARLVAAPVFIAIRIANAMATASIRTSLFIPLVPMGRML